MRGFGAFPGRKGWRLWVEDAELVCEVEGWEGVDGFDIFIFLDGVEK